MKTVPAIILSLLIMFVAASCTKKQYMAAADQSVDEDVNFDEYRTFDWSTQVDNKESSAFFLNDVALKAMVRKAVAYELDSRNYDYKSENADLVVNFRVFDEPTEITGLTGLGDGYWASNEVRSYDDRRTYLMDKGSVIVQLVDRESGRVVWQGYSSGLMDGNVLDKGENKVNETVSKIFDNYTYEAKADNS